MAPVTVQRFVKELEKLKQQVDAGTLNAQDYDARMARIIRELREQGLDADRAAITAALADAAKRGSSPPRSRSTSATASAWREGTQGRCVRPAGRGLVSRGRPGAGG